MNVDRAVLAFAAVMILVSLLLAWYVSPYWLLLDRVRGPEHAAGRLHRLLPGGHGVPQARAQGRLCVPVRSVSAAA